MQRPIGVTLLAVGAALAGLFQIWRALVFMGWASFNFVGETVSFPDPQWGQVIWALILAAIWFWVATGFWNVRAYAWSFGNFIAIFTLIWGFTALLFGSTVEAESIPWLLSGGIFLYLNYPGVRDRFVENEMSMLSPDQRVAMENLAAANAAAAGMTPRPTTVAPQVQPPASMASPQAQPSSTPRPPATPPPPAGSGPTGS